MEKATRQADRNDSVEQRKKKEHKTKEVTAKSKKLSGPNRPST